MRKLGLVVIILSAIAIGWFYLANKFEKIVNDEILPRLKNSTLIEADLDSVVIEKFRFQLTLHKVNILPDSDSIASDIKAVISYNPIFDDVTVFLGGGSLIKIPGQDGIYTSSSNQKVTFNRAMIASNTNEFDVKLTASDFIIYSTHDNEVIVSADEFSSTFLNKLDSDDIYDLALKINADAMLMNPESRYFEYVFDDLDSKYNSNIPKTVPIIFSKLMSYLYASKDKKDARSYKGKYSLKFKKQYIDKYLEFLKSGDKEILNELSRESDPKVFLQGSEIFKNKTTSDSGSIQIEIDNKKVGFKSDIAMLRNYTDVQKKEFINQAKEFFLDIAKIVDSDPESFGLDKDFNMATTLDRLDITPLLTILANNREISLSIDSNANNEKKDIRADHSVKLVINDFIFKLAGNIKGNSYEGKATIETPAILVNGITNLYYNGIRPLLLQMHKDKVLNSFEYYDKLASNVRGNGIDALAAFHKDDKLNSNNILLLDIIFNPKSFAFEINGKNIFVLLADSRVLKFLNHIRQKDKTKE